MFGPSLVKFIVRVWVRFSLRVRFNVKVRLRASVRVGVDPDLA